METFAPAYFDYMSSSVYADVSDVFFEGFMLINISLRDRLSLPKFLDAIN